MYQKQANPHRGAVTDLANEISSPHGHETDCDHYKHAVEDLLHCYGLTVHYSV